MYVEGNESTVELERGREKFKWMNVFIFPFNLIQMYEFILQQLRDDEIECNRQENILFDGHL